MSPIDAKMYAVLAPLVAPEVLILADQNAPRPASPYWTMKSSPRRQIGSDTYGQDVDDNGDIEVRGVRELTVQVQRIGDGSDAAVQSLRDDLSRITVQEACIREGVAVFNTGEVQSVPYLLDPGNLEPRGILDLFVRFQTKLVLLKRSLQKRIILLRGPHQTLICTTPLSRCYSLA
jgi:hypothetical protein